MPRSPSDQVLGKLIALGWQKSDSHLLLAELPVKTFRGVVNAGIELPVTFENGVQSFRAVFISEERNALASCGLYVRGSDGPEAIAAKTAEFHTSIESGLTNAYSVRVARPEKDGEPIVARPAAPASGPSP